MANWKMCIEWIAVSLPTGHDVHRQQQSMGNCVQICRPTTHTCTHPHSPWIELLFIGLQIGVMPWLRRWHHSAPAAPSHGTILIGVMWLWTIWSHCHGEEAHDLESRKITAELPRISLKIKERIEITKLKPNNRENPDGKKHSWVYEGAQGWILCYII